MQRSTAWRATRLVASTAAVPASVVTAVAPAGVLAGIILAPGEASKDFYSAVVGIIPVLLLTLAIQLRFFRLPDAAEIRASLTVPERRPGQDRADYLLAVMEQQIPSVQRLLWRATLGLAILGLLVVGEFFALHPLATGHPNDGNPTVVYAALATGFLMIGALAVLGPAPVNDAETQSAPAGSPATRE